MNNMKYNIDSTGNVHGIKSTKVIFFDNYN